MSLASDIETVKKIAPHQRTHASGVIVLYESEIAAAQRLAAVLDPSRPVALPSTLEIGVERWIPNLALRVVDKVVSTSLGWRNGRAHRFYSAETPTYTTEVDAIRAHQCDLADQFKAAMERAEERLRELEGAKT